MIERSMAGKQERSTGRDGDARSTTARITERTQGRASLSHGGVESRHAGL